MAHKHNYSFILALIISTNSFSMEKLEEDNFYRKLLLFSAVAITTFAFLIKLKSLFGNRSSMHVTHSQIYMTTTTDIQVCDNEIIINPNGSGQQSLAQLPLIRPSGKNTTIEFSSSIERIQVPGCIATVHIDPEQQPRIEKDTAFQDLIFTVQDGILTATTTDKKPRKFPYNKEKPLCTIYAHLLANKLVAEQHSRIDLSNQTVDTILSTNYSAVWGRIKSTGPLLDLKSTHGAYLNIIHNNNPPENTILQAENHATIKLEGKQLGILKATIHDYSDMYITGEATNPNIIANQHSTFNAPKPHLFEQTNLTAKGDTLTAASKNYSKVYVTGKVSDLIIVVSDFSTFDGSTMKANDARINIENNSTGNLGVIKAKITKGVCDSSSTLEYKGNPQVL